MKNNKSGKILNVLLGIIAFFAIVVIVFWLISKNNNTNNVSEFKDNLTKMQETAKNILRINYQILLETQQ